MSAFDLNLAVEQYTNTVRLLSQQQGSRLRETVMEGSHVGKQAVAVDQFAATVANKRTNRATPLVPADTQNDRRWVSPVDYDWNDLTDNFDKLRLLIDPTSYYVVNGIQALSRAMDDEIITAFFGTAKTGETGTTSTSFLSANQVNAAEGASSATGMNVKKLLTAKKKLLANEVDIRNQGLFAVMSAQQHDDLLNEIQVVNTDYNKDAVLMEGMVTKFAGINIILSERLPTNGSSQRRCAVYPKSAMHLGVWGDIMADVSQRKDLSGHPYQVYLTTTIGATRLEEKQIVELPCAE